MFRYFDIVRFGVVLQNVLGCIGDERQENAFARIRLEFCIAATRGAHPDLASEGAESGEVVSLTCGHLEWRLLASTRGNHILDAQEMMECIRPELDRESGSM